MFIQQKYQDKLFHVDGRHGEIICHPNTSGQFVITEVELYHGYGVHSIVILHYIYTCCRAQRKCLRYRPSGLAYINTPGRTCLHESSIEYEQVTAWVARFSSNKLEANYHQPLSALDDSMDMRTNRCHYSLVKLQTVSWKEPLAELLTRLIRDHL